MYSYEEINEILAISGVVDAALPFSAQSVRVLQRFADEVDKRARQDVLKNEFICVKCGLRKDSEHRTNHEF